MNESILRALMRLFAIVANVKKDSLSSNSREIVKSYLRLQLNNKLVEEYLDLFDEYLKTHQKKSDTGSMKERKRTSLNSVKVLMICEEINEQLKQVDKIVVLIRLLEFIHGDSEITENELDFITTVADIFNISSEEYHEIFNFMTNEFEKIEAQKKLLIINNHNSENKEFKNIPVCDENIDELVAILHVESTNTYLLQYLGDESLYLNAVNIIPRRVYIFEHGSVIRGSRISPIYYTDISRHYILDDGAKKVVLIAKDIEFRFKNSTNGIHKFSLMEESGNMLGIMGGSGVGKSTLLNVLNGNLKLKSGSITINGYDLHKDKEQLEGVIGFVPQDDLLIEELTVYQNLYYNAKLCFSNFSEQEINKVVENILLDLDLIEIKNLKVGGPLNKFISGGQRKRLNIALELMREPSILIVDEPTSGLSSQDSEMVMSLLKEQTLKGKLVLVNIHQPSSYIFKLFDKLLILDKGGFPVYYGNPIDSVVYFKTESNHVNASERECGVCGNVNPDLPLQILETKMVNEYGKFTRVRKILPQEWYNRFEEKLQPKIKISETIEKSPLPDNKFKIPGRFKQFKIFSIRNLLSKLTNKQYLLINLLESPILAVILGYFTKYISGTPDNPNKYLFSENENIPAYLFMCVIVALFVGLTVSAEEIIRDQKILKRESFLNLSWISYLNSKIGILFIISAIQTLSFILVGNYILEIKWMTSSYFIIIFSTMASANLIGLNISSALNSVVTIYITIPFILVPQILLSGVIVNFSKLHKNFMNVEYVPVIGDLMISRWSYEALAVNQFKNNEFEKHFFDVDKEISSLTFQSMFRLPELQLRVNRSIRTIKQNKPKDRQFTNDMILLKNEFLELKKELPKIKFNAIGDLDAQKFTVKTGNIATDYIENLKKYYRNKAYYANLRKDEIYAKLIEKIGKQELLSDLKNDYYNKRLADFVLNKNEIKKIVETDRYTLFQTKDPIFEKPATNYGRAHFYAAEKNFLGMKLSTMWFDVAVIWFATISMYIILIFNGLKRLIDFTSNIHLLKSIMKRLKKEPQIAIED